MPSPAPPWASAMVTSPPSGPSVLAVSLQRAGRHQRVDADLRVVGAPLQLAHGEPVAVGGEQGDVAAAELEPDAGHHRQRLVAAGGDRDLGDRRGEGGGVDRAGAGRHLRQGRVVLDRHRRQGEPGAAADELEVRADGGDVDRLAGQRLGDLGEQAAGDQRGAVGVALDVDGHLAGDLVVEAGDLQAAVGDPQHHTGEHRHGRPAGQALRRPRHSVGERVALHSELHALPPGRLGTGPGADARCPTAP